MVAEIKVEELNEAAYNPRIQLTPDMPEYQKLKRSIEEFGNAVPIVWNKKTGNVVGGHQRLTVLKDMGYESVPCSIVELDEKEEKLLNIALNKIKGEWDYDKLEKILKDFDYEVATASGFSAEEIAIILADNSDIDDNIDLDFWDDEEEDELIGGSYVVTLVFEDSEKAAEWAENNGFKDRIRENTTTTVIRIED